MLAKQTARRHLMVVAVGMLVLGLAVDYGLGTRFARAEDAEKVKLWVDGDAERGKQKAAVCAACHGADGNSQNPQWPSLAGQVSGYIYNQLKAFKEGAEGPRNNVIMMGQAAALSDQDMKDLDVYYAALDPRAMAAPEDKAELIQAGRKLFRGGDADRGIPACMGCHTPNGVGVPPNFPRISGQHAEYLKMQLLAFRAEQRHNDMMTNVATRLTENQIEALSWYLQGLQ